MPGIARHRHIEIHTALLQINNHGVLTTILEVLALDVRQGEKSSLGCQAEPLKQLGFTAGETRLSSQTRLFANCDEVRLNSALAS